MNEETLFKHMIDALDLAMYSEKHNKDEKRVKNNFGFAATIAETYVNYRRREHGYHTIDQT